jgi:alpha-ribazole phosphatase
MTELPTEWWLVRHAPTINPDKMVYGSLDLDVELPPTETFEALSEMLPIEPVWMISNLSRTRKTLDRILAARGTILDEVSDDIHIEPHFAEQHFGEWEGRPSAEVWAEIRDAKKSWPADITPPGGENFSQVAARVKTAALYWSERLRGRPVVAVLHSGSIRSFLSAAMGDQAVAALSYSVDTLSVSRCDYFAPGSWRIGFVNRRPK